MSEMHAMVRKGERHVKRWRKRREKVRKMRRDGGRSGGKEREGSSFNSQYCDQH